jgi:hypothetical protein
MMNKKEALEALTEYEDDFESISSVLDDDSLTPSQKISAIGEIIQDEEDEEDGDDDDDDES